MPCGPGANLRSLLTQESLTFSREPPVGSVCLLGRNNTVAECIRRADQLRSLGPASGYRLRSVRDHLVRVHPVSHWGMHVAAGRRPGQLRPPETLTGQAFAWWADALT
ncbi:hypothetical protein GCM10020367_63760 [Streptomyces sannanensis]|uniref:Uncharacterized protein n=1 Tax=Streptomyces sannanensis TaxID=285536 RepID=A0ABP6SL39_9ACTN